MLHIYDNIDNITARTIPWLKGEIKKLCLPSLLQNINVERINLSWIWDAIYTIYSCSYSNDS